MGVLKCEVCHKRTANMKCDRFIRTKGMTTAPAEFHSLDVCRICYKKVMMERAYPTLKFHNSHHKRSNDDRKIPK